MTIANMYEAKTKLSKLVQQALEGEEVVVAKFGKPLVKLVPVEPQRPRRIFGLMKDCVEISPDFDRFSPELEDMFSDYIPSDRSAEISSLSARNSSDQGSTLDAEEEKTR